MEDLCRKARDLKTRLARQLEQSGVLLGGNPRRSLLEDVLHRLPHGFAYAAE